VRSLLLLLLLPAAFIGLLWLVIADHRDKLGLSSLSARGALVLAYLAFEALVAFITEASSYGRHFDSTTVIVMWGIALAILVALSRRSLAGLRGIRLALTRALAALTVEERIWIATIICAFGIFGAIGWLYPPNNADSMVYHLPRVVHWIQDRSVAQFATHYLAQIELSPLHEYNLAHLHLLAGGSDRLDGYVQLSAAAICVVGVSELARLLGASRRGQLIAAALCLTIPTGILEATSTQNNYFAASIGLAMLVLLCAWRPGKGWTVKAIALGLAGGLAILTKGTLPLLIAPAAFLLAVVVIRRELQTFGVATALRRLLAVAAIATTAAAVVCGPFLLRNVELFGGPTGPVSQSTISSDLTVNAALGNVLRSTAAEFWIGNGKTGLETSVSKLVLRNLKPLYAKLGVSPADPRYALGTNTDAFKVQDYTPFQREEDFGANPWHAVLLVLAGFALAAWVVLGKRSLRVALLLAIGLALGYILFTGTARWSAFNVRYALPLLVAWCPLIALVLERLWKAVGSLVLIGLVVACLPALLDNARRPLIHPQYHYTSNLQPYFLDTGKLGGIGGHGVEPQQYEAVTTAIAQSGCKRLGLANWVLIEYPIWAGLRDADWNGTIEQVGVTNQSRKYERAGFDPCAEIRQEDPGYVTADNGNVQMQFGKLALSIDPRRVGTVETRVPGFSSTIANLRVFPGGGWSLNGKGPGPTLLRGGSLYLSSRTAHRVTLRMVVPPGVVPPHLVVDAPGVAQGPVGETAGLITVDLQVPSGTTRLQLDTTPAAGSFYGVLPLVAVQVQASAAPR
jgi:hypothetical protein